MASLVTSNLTKTQTTTASILLLDNMLATSACLPLEMLHAADNIAKRQRSEKRIITQTVSVNSHKVSTQSGLQLLSNTTIKNAPPPTLLIVPSFWRNPLRGLKKNKPLLKWISNLHANGTHICTVSTGSFLLAEAGILDGCAATTHWFYLDTFTKRYPKVNVQRKHFITNSERIYCAGSLNGTADLMVYFIGLLFDEHIARQVESQFSPEVRRQPNESLYIEGRAELHHDEDIAAIQHYLSTHSSQAINMNELAETHQLNSRTLNRRFKLVTGLTPTLYLQKRRVEDARELLHKSNLSIAELASTVGYQDVSHFSYLFRKHMGMTPRAYRESVRGKLFSV